MKTTNPAKAGSLTLDTRLAMTEMPAGTSGQVLTAQGAGNDPAYAAPITFTELDNSITKQAAVTNTWEDWDLSASVPANTKSVLLIIRSFEADQLVGARKKGSGLDRRFSISVQFTTLTLVVNLDANHICEIYSVFAATSANFYLFGYWS